MNQTDRESNGTARRALIVVAVVAAALGLWTLRSVLLLAFAAALIAVLLDSLAKALRKRARVGKGASLALVLIALLAVIALTSWLFGGQVAAQFGGLRARLPTAWLAAQAQLRAWGVFDEVVTELRHSLPGAGAVLGFVSGLLSGAGTVLAGLGLAVVGGVYLASNPQLYVDGFIGLWPPGRRSVVRNTFDALDAALLEWLRAQSVSMLAIGTLITLGLWAIGLPSFLALGLIAGLVQFVPLVGSFVAAVPGILVAVAFGPATLGWTIAVYIVVQQLDSNFISPLVQRRFVSLPPALILFSVIAFGLLFGAVGVALAVPLAVCAYVLIGKLWVRDTLGEPLKLPGER